MKRFFAVLSICMVLCVVGAPELQANKGKVIKKGFELITKGAKKAPKKTPAVKPKSPVRSTTPKPRQSRPTPTVTCSQCNGRGTVTSWNSYYEQFQTATCSKCHGSGKVRHN